MSSAHHFPSGEPVESEPADQRRPSYSQTLFVLSLVLLVFVIGLAALISYWLLADQEVVLLPPTVQRTPGMARIVASPPSGVPGTVLQILGANWHPGDVVFVSLEAPFTIADRDFAYAGAVVDDDGTFRVRFTFPEEDRWGQLGAVKIVAWAEESGAKAVTIFQVVPSTVPARLVEEEGGGPLLAAVAETPTPPVRVEPTPSPTPVAIPSPAPLPATHWYGQYFDNPSLSGTPAFSRDDKAIDFNWGRGAPGEAVGADGFSVRWTRNVDFSAGVYRFFVRVDDGVRLWVDDRLLIDQWHDSAATTYVADTYLWEGRHQLRLEYYERAGEALVRLWWERQEVFPDWKGEYFANAALQGNPALVRNDPEVRFNWGGDPPAQGLRSDNFSVRWSRRTRFAQGSYRFYIRADDGMRVWLDSTLVIDFWDSTRTGLRSIDLSLSEGEYSIRVEHRNSSGPARAEFRWERVAAPMPPSPPAVSAPALASADAPPSPTLSPGSPVAAMEMPTPALPEADRPALALTANESKEGLLVTVTGTGWPAGQSVRIWLSAMGEEDARMGLSDDVEAETSSDAQGIFDTIFILSEPWRKVRQIHVVARVAGQAEPVSAVLQLGAPMLAPALTPTVGAPPISPKAPSVIRPVLRVAPSAAVLGGELAVIGEGWKPGDEVILSLVEPGGDLAGAPPVARALVDENGSFDVTVVPGAQKWFGYSELIVLAHNVDWTTRLVTPLRIASPPAETPVAADPPDVAPSQEQTPPAALATPSSPVPEYTAPVTSETSSGVENAGVPTAVLAD